MDEIKIGLIDVDGHNYPNLALMKLSEWHKSIGDDVEWWWEFSEYDRVYISKVFDETYTEDIPDPLNAREIIRGGTGYGLDNYLPDEVEHMMPDWSIYPEYTKNVAYGFLTRGCPNDCPFCIVSKKEGRKSVEVADLCEWYSGQKEIVLMDPNLLACKDWKDLLKQLQESGASVDFNQGLDCKLLTIDKIDQLLKVKIKNIHFAWDLMERSEQVLAGLQLWTKYGRKAKDGTWGTVYVLTNFNTTMEENLYRIKKLADMNFTPFVMVYDKPNAKPEIKNLQRWCNSVRIRKKCPNFLDYGKKERIELIGQESLILGEAE